ncbi:hypothetical protein ACFQ1S_07930 [Kibdelosporangium lantanae]|uniref:Uncharacterized protein n=1 Tax=Kibdelosporangium lantanae TaxID=1497396 RepID=A0ABW3M4S1_9PSEU
MTDNNPSQTAPTESVEEGQPRRGKAVPVLVALVVVLVLAAGAFGTLWFMEKGDHRATNDQLTAARADADAAKAKGQKAEAREREANDTMMRNSGEQEKAKDKITQAYVAITAMSKGSTACAQAGRKFADVLSSGTAADVSNAASGVVSACGG